MTKQFSINLINWNEWFKIFEKIQTLLIEKKKKKINKN